MKPPSRIDGFHDLTKNKHDSCSSAVALGNLRWLEALDVWIAIRSKFLGDVTGNCSNGGDDVLKFGNLKREAIFILLHIAAGVDRMWLTFRHSDFVFHGIATNVSLCV